MSKGVQHTNRERHTHTQRKCTLGEKGEIMREKEGRREGGKDRQKDREAEERRETLQKKK